MLDVDKDMKLSNSQTSRQDYMDHVDLDMSDMSSERASSTLRRTDTELGHCFDFSSRAKAAFHLDIKMSTPN